MKKKLITQVTKYIYIFIENIKKISAISDKWDNINAVCFSKYFKS